MTTLDGQEWLAERFEAHRARLRALAFRMLGSMAEAEDAVQETWLRLSHSRADDIDNLGGWLTTVAARICLDTLRARAARKEEPLDSASAIPRARPPRRTDPEEEAITADAVGLALLVVLDRLAPPERIAFVLHDLFGVPFTDIGPIVGRTPAAAKKLASRARAKVRGGHPRDADLSRRWRLIELFLAALREGDLRALLAVLDPDVVRLADQWAVPPGAPAMLQGAETVGTGTMAYGRTASRFARLALIDGNPGIVVAPYGDLHMAIHFGIGDEKITEIIVIAEPARLAALTIAVPAGGGTSDRTGVVPN